MGYSLDYADQIKWYEFFKFVSWMWSTKVPCMILRYAYEHMSVSFGLPDSWSKDVRMVMVWNDVYSGKMFLLKSSC